MASSDTQVPIKALDKWTVDEVARWLGSKFPQFAQVFKDMDGDAMSLLSEEQIARHIAPITPNAMLATNVFNQLQRMKTLTQIPSGLSSAPDAESSYKFKEGNPLQSGTGSDWEYQCSEDVICKVQNSLPEHFSHWQMKKNDKTKHPVYIIPAAPGTGKSRMLDEFRNICQQASVGHVELSERLKQNVFVFKCTFENGSPPGTTVGLLPSHQIGVRMQHQLWDWPMHACYPLARPCGEVISQVLKAENIDPANATIILLLDGIQKVYAQGPPQMSHIIDEVSALVNSTNFTFVIAAVAGTFYDPIEKCLKASSQYRVILTPPPVNGQRVIKPKHPIECIFVDDMGGHGRALGALKDVLANFSQKTTLDYNPEFVFSLVVAKVLSLYPDLASKAFRLRLVIAAILGHMQVHRDTSLGAVTVEDAISMGLFHYDQTSKRLKCPFILIYIFAQQSGDNMMAHLPQLSYNQLKGASNAPCTGLYWQSWEEFVGQFRILKSYFYHGQRVPFSQLHAGALNAPNTVVLVPALTALEELDKIYSPKEALALLTQKPLLCLRNAQTAEYADGYCCLKIGDTKVLESHRYKKQKGKNNAESFKEEYQKAISSTDDFFIFFSTGKATMDTMDKSLHNCALVCRDNFSEYFGPFAGRAFCTRKNINTATWRELSEVPGIGPTKAKRLVAARKTLPFKKAQDLK